MHFLNKSSNLRLSFTFFSSFSLSIVEHSKLRDNLVLFCFLQSLYKTQVCINSYHKKYQLNANMAKNAAWWADLALITQ